MLGLNNRGGVAAVARAQPTQQCVPLQGVPPAGLGEGVGDCRDVVVTQKGALFGFSAENSGGENYVLFPFFCFFLSKTFQVHL